MQIKTTNTTYNINKNEILSSMIKNNSLSLFLSAPPPYYLKTIHLPINSIIDFETVKNDLNEFFICLALINRGHKAPDEINFCNSK